MRIAIMQAAMRACGVQQGEIVPWYLRPLLWAMFPRALCALLAGYPYDPIRGEWIIGGIRMAHDVLAGLKIPGTVFTVEKYERESGTVWLRMRGEEKR